MHNSRVLIDQYKYLYYTLLLLVFSIPLIEITKQLSLGIIILYGGYIIYKEKLKLDTSLPFYALLLFSLSAIIGALLTDNPLEALGNIKYFIRLFLVFAIFSLFTFEIKHIKQLIFAATLGYLIALAWGYFSYYQHDFAIHYFQLKSVGHRNHSSLYMLNMFTLFASIFFFHFKTLGSKKNLLFVILLAFTFFSIFLSGSRATMYSSLGIIFLIAFYLLILHKKATFILVPLGFVGASYLLITNYSFGMEKFTMGVIDPIRLNIYTEGLKFWWESGHLLFGLGAGNFDFAQNHYNVAHAHNTYINYLVENGILGLVSYCVFIFSLLYLFLKKLYHQPHNYMLVGALLLWITNFIISFANTTFHHENALFMLLVWIIALNSSRKEKRCAQ